jgi:lanosterol synthase
MSTTTKANGKANGVTHEIDTPKHDAFYDSDLYNDVATEHVNLSTIDKTARSRWRLIGKDGQQRWTYLHSQEEADAWPQSTADRWHLGLSTDRADLPTPRTPLEALDNGLTFFETLQLPPGQWACDYGGPMFLIPGLVVTWYITKTPIPVEYRVELRNYLFEIQNKTDHGWGLHIEGISSVFGTAMNYTTLRLLGVDADDDRMIKARALLHQMGGAVNGPHWAKFWLTVLGVCEWEAVNPVPPELWYVF